MIYKVASRYLFAGRGQTLLMLSLVCVGITAYAFITSTVQGIQSSAIKNTLGSSAHITIEPFDNLPYLDPELTGSALVSKVQTGQQREKKIDNWQSIVRKVESIPGIKAVSPTVLGSGFAEKGTQSRPITIRGGYPEQLDSIVNIKEDLESGEFRITPGTCVIGSTLAKKLNIVPGDRLRLLSNKNLSQSFQLAGVVYAGSPIIDEQTVFVYLSDAQRLAAIGSGISVIEMAVPDVFLAKTVSDRAQDVTGLESSSWQETSLQIVNLLSSQNLATGFIRLFALVSVALGIAAVLNVTVTQKSKEIGILKAMGAVQSQILFVFIFLGASIGLIGGSAGAAASIGINFLIRKMAAEAPKGSPTFAVEILPHQLIEAVVIACLIAAFGAYLPARKASRLDPVEAIRSV